MRFAVVALAIVGCGRFDFDSRGDGGSTCSDGVRDGDETGVDCGGSCAIACPGDGCMTGADCITGSCAGNTCALASGPPSWLPGPELIHPRGWLGCAIGDDNRIYAVGGDSFGTPTFTPSTYVEALVPGETWVTAPGLMTPRYSLAVAADNEGAIYAVAGDQTIPSTAERYAAGAWTPIAAMTAQHDWIYGAFGIDDTMYVTDNYAVDEYTPSIGTWTEVATPTQFRDMIASARGSDDNVYIIGGETGSGVPQSEIDRIDPGATITQVASLTTARKIVSAASAPDGRVYVIGGLGAMDLVTDGLASVEAFTPGQSVTVPVAPLTLARAGAGTVVGPDQRIYAVGGYVDATVTGTVEIYGPSAQVMVTGGSITVAGANFAALATIAGQIAGVTGPAFTATTDATGDVNASFAVGTLASGAHEIAIEDVKSQYPIVVSFTVP